MGTKTHTIAVIAVTLLLAAAAVTGWECYWRAQGHEPALHDDRDLWSQHREQAISVDQSRNFTVIGASRIQLAFSSRSFEEAQPGWHATLLAINGHYPAAVLADLAADERFSGVLLVATDARGLSHWHRGMSQPWVRHYHRDYGPQRRLERRLLSALQQRLVIVGSEFNLIRRLDGAIQGRPPVRHYTRLLPDRSIAADYRQADVIGLRSHFITDLAAAYADRPAPPAERWLADLADIKQDVAAVQARGGRVIFLRMPTADAHWQLDQENYPRSSYWDRLAAASGAATIHFADYPELADLDLPDTSHIDGSDRDRFTRALVDILARTGALPPS